MGLPGFLSPATIGALGLSIFAFAHIIRARSSVRYSIVLALLAFLSVGFASYVGLGLRLPGRSEVAAADRGIILLIAWTGVAVFASVAVRGARSIDAVTKAVVACTSAIAVVALLQVAGLSIAELPLPPGFTRVPGGDDPAEVRDGLLRVSGTTAHPIELGVLLASALPLALTHRGFGARWYWKAAAGLIVVALPLTVSRSSVAALAAAIVVLAVFASPRQRLVGAVAVAMAAVLITLVIPQYMATLLNLFVGWRSDPSVSGRLVDFAASANYVTDRPLLGVGFRTFTPDRYFFVDNQFLMSLLDMGILGLAGLCLLVALAFRGAAAAAFRHAEPGMRNLAKGLTAALTASIVGMASFDGLSFPTFASFFFILVGVSGSAYLFNPTRRVREAS